MDSIRQCKKSIPERNLTGAQNYPQYILCEMENGATKLPGRRCARGRPALSIHSHSSLSHSVPLTGRAVAEKGGWRGRDTVISEQEQAERSVILAFSHHLDFYYFKKNSTAETGLAQR